MAPRSEAFSIRNILLIGLFLTVLYGVYSYNALRNNFNKSNVRVQTYKIESEQYSLQLKAALKTRMSCMKDLKQLRTSMWELKSKITDAETEVKKQKNEAEFKILNQRREMDNCKTQLEGLQKELVKLKEDDRVKMARSKEDGEENEKKVKKMATEHEMALSRLRDEVQDLKTENEKLKNELAAAAKRNVHVKRKRKMHTEAAAKPKRSDEDTPRQMQPPGVKKTGRSKSLVDEPILTNSTTASNAGPEVDRKGESGAGAAGLTSTMTLAQKGGTKPVDKSNATLVVTPRKDTDVVGRDLGVNPVDNDSKKDDKSGKERANKEEKPIEVKEGDKNSDKGHDSVPFARNNVLARQADKGDNLNKIESDGEKAGRLAVGDEKAGRPAAGDEKAGRPAAGDEKAGRPAAGAEKAGRPEAGAEKAGRPAAGDEKAGRPAEGDEKAGRPAAGDERVERPAVGEKDKPVKAVEDKLRFHPVDDEKREDKPVRDTNIQAAMDKMRRGRAAAIAAAAAKEDKHEQQVAMPLPQAAAKRNIEPNQLPQPVHDNGVGGDDKVMKVGKKFPKREEEGSLL